MENLIFLCSESGTSKRKSSVCQQELEEYKNQSTRVKTCPKRVNIFIVLLTYTRLVDNFSQPLQN